MLLGLYEAVEAERGLGRRHVLEPGLVEGRRRAARIRPRDLVKETGATGGHRRAELRSLAYHRALAKRLRRAMADDALRLVWQWRESGQMDAEYADRWEELLRRPLPEIRAAITADDQRGRDLRQNSPFAGVLSEPERQRILAEIR